MNAVLALAAAAMFGTSILLAQGATGVGEPQPVEIRIPEYPLWARKARVQVTIVVRASIGPDGTVNRALTVKDPFANHKLDDLLEESLSRWRFPAASGQAVRASDITFHFVLGDETLVKYLPPNEVFIEATIPPLVTR